MRATLSESAGLFIRENPTTGIAEMIALQSMQVVNDDEYRYSSSAVRDWKIVEAASSHELISKAILATKLRECLSYANLCLTLCGEAELKPAYRKIDSIFQTYVQPSQLLNNLLAAPLKDKESANRCARESLELGFASIGDVFNRLYDLQPLLGRFMNIWLSAPMDVFRDIGQARELVWRSYVESGLLLKILEAPSKSSIASHFGLLAFEKSIPSERAALASLGSFIGNSIFGKSSYELSFISHEDDSPSNGKLIKVRKKKTGTLTQALIEIAAIEKALAGGDDRSAYKYLHELVARQQQDDIEYAVKSLCHMAMKSADMFRFDFERYCLELANQINPTDVWTKSQLADYFKRTGEFDKAEAVAKDALLLGGNSIIQSLLADITSHRGNFQDAIDKYKLIPNWEYSSEIRTAIADNLRRLGRFEEARFEYESLESDGLSSDRVIAGRAEILRREGNLLSAVKEYECLLKSDNIEVRSRQIYSLSLASALKQNGDIEASLRLVEEVIQSFPFSMRARVLRASIWALLGREGDGLSDLSGAEAITPDAIYGAWTQSYTRGLILLKTDRFKDGQSILVKAFELSSGEIEAKETLRLASAISFLFEKDSQKAAEILDGSRFTHNSYLEYLRTVLKYHICTLESDEKGVEKYLNILESEKDNNIYLWSAVQAISRSDTKVATDVEINALLRLSVAA